MKRIRRSSLIVLISLVIICLMPLVNSALAAQDLASLSSVLTHIKVGWLKLASVEVTQALEGSLPLDGEFLLLSGLLLNTNGQPDLARQAYFRALESDQLGVADEATLLALVGRTYFDQQDYRAAKDYHNRALAISGDQVFSLVDLGAIALREGELATAGQYLDRAEKAGGAESARLYIVRGDQALASADYASALDQYRLALKLAPTDEQVYYRMKQVFQQTGKLDQWSVVVEQARAYGVVLN